MIKQTAQQIARQIDPSEFLKTATEQIGIRPQPQEEEQKQTTAPSKVEGKKPDLSFLNNYKQELEEIRRESLFKELQQKISEGEFVPLENYIKELSFEQREVLQTQIYQ